MKTVRTIDIVGPNNDWHLIDATQRAALVIAAWGNHGKYRGRDGEVSRLLADRNLKALRISKTNVPGHPLYLPYHSPIMGFKP